MKKKSKTLQFFNYCRFSESSSNKDKSHDESDDGEGVACEAQVCEVEKTTEGKVYWVQCENCALWYNTICVGLGKYSVKELVSRL